MKREVLKVSNIEKYYGNKSNITKAINNISFTVEEGEFIGVMGASGSGKTTLLNCISTIDKVSSGHIFINNNDITKLNTKKIAKFRREELGFIFQDFNLLDTLTCYENIALALTISRVNHKEIDSRVKEVASKLGIIEILNKYPYEVAGGQKQRGATCRALISEPEILFADEPTGALDSRSSRDLLERLKMINDEGKATILMVTHDPFSASYAKDVYILSDGMMKCRLTRGNSRKELYDRIIDTQIAMGSDFA